MIDDTGRVRGYRAAHAAPNAFCPRGSGARSRARGGAAGATGPYRDPVTSLVLLVCALPLGLWVHARRSLLDSLTERAERAERERNLATALEAPGIAPGWPPTCTTPSATG